MNTGIGKRTKSRRGSLTTTVEHSTSALKLVCDLKGHIICLRIETNNVHTRCRIHNKYNYHCGRCSKKVNNWRDDGVLQDFVIDPADEKYFFVPAENDSIPEEDKEDEETL